MIRRAFDEDSAADIRFERRQERLAEEADEREAEDRADARAERRCETWTERGERWQEDVAYGEIR